MELRKRVGEGGTDWAENKGRRSLHLGQGPRFCFFNPKPLANMAYKGAGNQKVFFNKSNGPGELVP